MAISATWQIYPILLNLLHVWVEKWQNSAFLISQWSAGEFRKASWYKLHHLNFIKAVYCAPTWKFYTSYILYKYHVQHGEFHIRT